MDLVISYCGYQMESHFSPPFKCAFCTLASLLVFDLEKSPGRPLNPLIAIAKWLISQRFMWRTRKISCACKWKNSRRLSSSLGALYGQQRNGFSMAQSRRKMCVHSIKWHRMRVEVHKSLEMDIYFLLWLSVVVLIAFLRSDLLSSIAACLRCI